MKTKKITRKMKVNESDLPPVEPLVDPSTGKEVDPYSESFESPESSNIAGASYDLGDLTLTITFKGKGGSPQRVYKYHDFPYDLWQQFKASDSKGRFSNSEITPHYTGELQS